jgi:SAM-dependent methyltransferase
MSSQSAQPSFHPGNYPFGEAGRASVRLLFDFSIGIGCFPSTPPNQRVLDFACGTGWTSEWLNRIGYDVHGFDYDAACIEAARARAKHDVRLDDTRLQFLVADGHQLPYPADFFGLTFCFDSLHHMADYLAVFRELHRVVAPGGRCVFVEPGARHSTSSETVNFLREHPKPTWWIERDVPLLEVRDLALACGFEEPRVKPFLLPEQVDFAVTDWFHMLENPIGQKNHLAEWRRSCWDDRVVFYLDKPVGISSATPENLQASSQ